MKSMESLIKEEFFFQRDLKLINRKSRKVVSGGSYGTNYRSKRNVVLVYFGFPIDPRGLGVMRNEALLDVRVQGRRFDSFGDQTSNSVNRVFS